MPKIKPVSDLRNYNEVLKDIGEGEPVFLTKNGRRRYVIIDIDEYEKNTASLKLVSKLLKAENEIKNGNSWLTDEETKEQLGL